MTDSDNILTATLAELKTYFEGWHQSDYARLHINFQDQINDIKNKIIDNKIAEALKNYYNKADSDARYLLDNKTQGEKKVNSVFSDEHLLIRNNTKNKDALVTTTQDGLFPADLYNSVLQVVNPGVASGTLAMQTRANGQNWNTNGSWKNVNPVYDRYYSNFQIYKNNFGSFVQMVRFGAMRTLNMGYQPNHSQIYSRNTFVGLNPRWSFWDLNVNQQRNQRYYLVCRIATEDEPIDNGGFIEGAYGYNISFTNFKGDALWFEDGHTSNIVSFPGDGKGGANEDQYAYGNNPLPDGRGTYLVVSGGDCQNDISSISTIASLTWIAKNIKNDKQYDDYTIKQQQG